MTSVQSTWTFALTDYTGISNGPVFGATARTFSHPLNGMRTCSFTIDVENPAALFLFNPPQHGGLPSYPLVKLYRRDRTGAVKLVMVGDVASMKIANRSSEGGGQITVIAADGVWRLNKRLVGMGYDSYGRGLGYTYASAYAQVPLSQIIDDLLNDTNTVTGWTGIRQGNVPTTGSLGAIDPPVFQQPVAPMIAQLSAMLGGPDYEITPMEPVVSTGPMADIGTLNCYVPIGSTRTNVVFEYGAGQRNVSAYDVTWDKTGQINKAWSLPQGFPSAVAAGDYTVSATDAASIAAYGVWEDSIPSDVTTIPVRQELCNEFVAVRRYPRQQITFTPASNNNNDYGVDYIPGDIVQASAVDADVIIYDGNVRIYGVALAMSDNEAESVSLTLIPA